MEQADAEDPSAGVADLVGEGAAEPRLQALPEPGVIDAGTQLAADFPGDAPLHVDAGLPVEPVDRFEHGVHAGADGQSGAAVGTGGVGQGGARGLGQGVGQGSLVVIRAQRESTFAVAVRRLRTAVFHSFTYLYLAYGG
ncbi:hypothetical protein ACIP10_35405 [Streptomyces galbus]|uniref:hypothetical protein n=1 Tax=Streptomyces galbus TaxID=33898 RepID=UPI0037FA8AC9